MLYRVGRTGQTRTGSTLLGRIHGWADQVSSNTSRMSHTDQVDDDGSKGVFVAQVILFALVVWIFLLDRFDSLYDRQERVFGFFGDYVFELRYGPWAAGVALLTSAVVGFAVRRRLGQRLTGLHELVETWASHQQRYPELHRRNWELDYQELAIRLSALESLDAERSIEKLRNRLIEGAHKALSKIAWTSGPWTYFWAVNEIGGTGWLPLIWVLLFLPFMALWLVTLLLCLGGYEDIDDRGAMVTLSAARRLHRDHQFDRSLRNWFLPEVPSKVRLSEATVHNLRQVSFSGANSFDAFVLQAQTSLGLGPAQLFVVAYDKQLTHDLERSAQVEKLWNGVLDEFVADPKPAG